MIHWDDLDIKDERDLSPPERTFVCVACRQEFDDYERVVMTRHPEMPSQCLNCVCSDHPPR